MVFWVYLYLFIPPYTTYLWWFHVIWGIVHDCFHCQGSPTRSPGRRRLEPLMTCRSRFRGKDKNDFIQWKWDITDVSETGKNKGNLLFHSILVRTLCLFGDATKKADKSCWRSGLTPASTPRSGSTVGYCRILRATSLFCGQILQVRTTLGWWSTSQPSSHLDKNVHLPGRLFSLWDVSKLNQQPPKPWENQQEKGLCSQEELGYTCNQQNRDAMNNHRDMGASKELGCK